MSAKTCPDCSASDDPLTFRHDPTCPIGLESDRSFVADHDWFAVRPGRDTRSRRPFLVEIQNAELFDLCDCELTRVIVSKVGPLLHSRTYLCGDRPVAVGLAIYEDATVFADRRTSLPPRRAA